MAIDVRVVTDDAALSRHIPEWDRLAVESGLPYCAPAWMLAWWRHAAPAGSELRVALIARSGNLVGVGPFYVEQRRGIARYRLLASTLSSRTQPLLDGGHEHEAAAALAEMLAGAQPSPSIVSFNQLEASDRWPALAVEHWAGGRAPRMMNDGSIPSPTIDLEGRSYEGWFGSRSGNFRRQMRRARRELDDLGAELRLAQAPQELERGLSALARLHYGNWHDRGGSGALDAGVEGMLADAGAQLASSGRFRVWTLTVDEEVIAARVVVAAGGEVAAWLSGYDERFAKQNPSFQTLLAAIEDGFERGERRFQLGPGGQEYKSRFADDIGSLFSSSLMPRSARYPITRLQLAPSSIEQTARRAVRGRLSTASRYRLRRFRSALTGHRGRDGP